MSNTPNQVTKKFKEQVETLISEGVVANQQEIVNVLNWNKSQMSQAMRGAKNIPLAVYRKFTSHYRLTPSTESLVNEQETSYGSDFKDRYIASLEKQNKLLEEQVNSATGELRHIAVMNFAMLKVMRKTVAQILAKVEKGDLLEIAGKIDKETATFYRSVRERGSLIDLGI